MSNIETFCRKHYFRIKQILMICGSLLLGIHYLQEVVADKNITRSTQVDKKSKNLSFIIFKNGPFLAREI